MFHGINRVVEIQSTFRSALGTHDTSLQLVSVIEKGNKEIQYNETCILCIVFCLGDSLCVYFFLFFISLHTKITVEDLKKDKKCSVGWLRLFIESAVCSDSIRVHLKAFLSFSPVRPCSLVFTFQSVEHIGTRRLPNCLTD